MRKAEEYRPGRVRYRYTTGVGLPAKVQSEWVCAFHVTRLSTVCSLSSTTANDLMEVSCVVVLVPQLLTISSYCVHVCVPFCNRQPLFSLGLGSHSEFGNSRPTLFWYCCL